MPINHIHISLEHTNYKPDRPASVSRRDQNMFCGPLLQSPPYLPSEACVIDTMGGILVTSSVGNISGFFVIDELFGWTALEGINISSNNFIFPKKS